MTSIFVSLAISFWSNSLQIVCGEWANNMISALGHWRCLSSTIVSECECAQHEISTPIFHSKLFNVSFFFLIFVRIEAKINLELTLTSVRLAHFYNRFSSFCNISIYFIDNNKNNLRRSTRETLQKWNSLNKSTQSSLNALQYPLTNNCTEISFCQAHEHCRRFFPFQK